MGFGLCPSPHVHQPIDQTVRHPVADESIRPGPLAHKSSPVPGFAALNHVEDGIVQFAKGRTDPRFLPRLERKLDLLSCSGAEGQLLPLVGIFAVVEKAKIELDNIVGRMFSPQCRNVLFKCTVYHAFWRVRWSRERWGHGRSEEEDA